MNYRLLPSDKNLSIVERILTNRNISLLDIEHYLNTSEKDVLNPLLLDNLKEGAKMLVKHLSLNNKIHITVDPDVDGFTSSALLINYLYKIAPSFVLNNIYYSLHEDKAHGILYEEIPKDVKMIIAPDCSSNEFELHAELANKGFDILVLDHHEADHVSNNACVINNQLCDYPTKSLSGVGIVYKFCSYLDELLNSNYANEMRDIVSLGLISDMMPLTDFETRFLVDEGLKDINNSFFTAMVNKNSYSLKNGLNPMGIAFYITPYINAVVRSGTLEEKTLVFEAMLEHKGNELIPSTKRGCKGQTETRVEQAVRTCVNCKKRQTEARDNNTKIIENIIQSKNLLDNKVLIVPLEDVSINRNLVGLIANQLMAEYQRPVLLLNECIDDMGNVTYEGSARGYEKSELKNFKDFLENSKLTMYQEGHQSAFGVGVTKENLQKLIKYCNEELKNIDFSPCYNVDFIYDNKTLNEKDILQIAELKDIWGQGVDECLIAIENIILSPKDISIMSANKNPTLKFASKDNISMIKFKSSTEEYENLLNQGEYLVMNFVGKCAKNEWMGNISAQILIEEYEIVKTLKYYF